MAKLNGLFQFEGTLEGYTVVKAKDGSSYLRRKGGVSKERIATDPNFARVRENLSEFSMVASTTKLIRTTFNGLKDRINFGSINSRLSSIVAQIKVLDSTSIRGQRKAALGITTAEGKAKLKGFSFSDGIAIDGVMSATYTVAESTGAVNIAGIVPTQHLVSGAGATKVGFKALWAKIDFTTNASTIVESNEVRLELNTDPSDVALTYAKPPEGTGCNVMVLVITFYQSVNGVDYILKNGSHNVAQITNVF